MSSTIDVSLLDEGTDVWRPVFAEQVRDDVYRITGTRADHKERWEFCTGDLVRCHQQRPATGVKGLVAYERLTNQAD